ncbi:MAG: hypothetical protein Q8J69_05565 [Sphingobacteriaceae bacterium]|nr:hypothetical protein [Sphingobacteriaceae bacterium]
MNELLSRLTNFSVVDYLSWIQQVLGESVYQQLLQRSTNVLNFEKVLAWHKQYLYGSKRLGLRSSFPRFYPRFLLSDKKVFKAVCFLETKLKVKGI